MRWVVLADGVAGVDIDLDMEAVVLEQDRGRARRIALVAGELACVLEAGLAARGGDAERAVLDRETGRILVGAGCQRGAVVEETAGIVDDLLAACRIVAAGTLGAAVLGDDVGAVEPVIEAAPARIGGIQGISGSTLAVLTASAPCSGTR
jgi:hypothetical protein